MTIRMMQYVKHRNYSLPIISVAGCVALIYIVLLAMSAGCALAHAGGVQHHQHHGNESSSTQNAVCAWACQATTDVTVAVGPPLAVTEQVVRLDDVFISGLVPFSYLSALRSRAPPMAPFVRLG
jgi:hypothetical protein